ncbi:uncharacterized protein JN550_000732 [Neoarthrinium moseri]|uniref:uncharacterized protein n=1 Tax=Neoarthrinium moseri TaxID=1658444 RepID=UPI001FDD6044|nr:uncharacterized protein JN550_000732 [Neoarthrinium moseri]KAI1878550.1 hypothetical protein JN550_000732 [Neoarthrinium moseri]
MINATTSSKPVLMLIGAPPTVSIPRDLQTTMNASEEIARLQRMLIASEERLEEEQRRREEEQRLREEEQRRREEAEELAKESTPQVLLQYLEACHSLSLAIQVVTDRSLTTQGDTTNPTGRIYPRRIIPWDDFAAGQEGIWERLAGGSFSSQPVFPTSNQLAYVRSLIHPISSELGLRDFERDTVENAVRDISFESHTNFGGDVNTISESLGNESISKHNTSAKSVVPETARRRARGKGNRADQFCIYRNEDGQNIPVVAIEYKPPHKLTQEEIVVGLRSAIQPQLDVIHKTGDSFEFASRTLAAAVVTQLFSYIIGKGVQYGYVYTGEVFIFLFIPEDPATVYYFVSVPNLDVLDDDPTRLHRTAVAQVFAFILQAVRVEPPPASWHDAAAELDIWAMEFDDVLRDIPATIRKERPTSAYKPQRWKNFMRSPIRTRSRCKPVQDAFPSQSDDEDDGDGPASPTPDRSSRSTKSTSTAEVQAAGQIRDRREQKEMQTGKHRIQDRPFCSRHCLSGLVSGGPIDSTCPNAKDHKPAHISRSEFLCRTRDQLAKDRGPEADCTPLYRAGVTGALFKVRLSSHGYTLVAKGMQQPDLPRLQHEETAYNHIKPMQGDGVPIFLGLVDLVLPYYYDCGVFTHFMFLNWEGRPLSESIGELNKHDTVRKVTGIYTRLHQLGVLHRDAELRNILYDSQHRRFCVIDFERALLPSREPLASISTNVPARKRKRGKKDRAVDPFAQELRRLCEKLSR